MCRRGGSRASRSRRLRGLRESTSSSTGAGRKPDSFLWFLKFSLILLVSRVQDASAPHECLLVRHTGFRLGVWSFYYLHCMSMSSPHEIETKAVVRLSAIIGSRFASVTSRRCPSANHLSRRPATGWLPCATAPPGDSSGVTTIGSLDMSGRVASTELN